jgi:preprotein translocase subunit SecF
MRFLHNTNIDFINKRMIFFRMSITIIVLGIVGSYLIGPVFGIDFEGGTEIGVEFESSIEASDVRSAIESAGFEGSEIKSFGGDNTFLVRVKDAGDSPTKVKDALNSAFPNNPHLTLKVDKIGPKIGREMRTQAFIAILLSVIAIMLYVAFRFEFAYGLGAILALVHDVVITFTLIIIIHKFGLINLEINQAILAALLTVIGISINDTVVIFDRIRENLERQKGKGFLAIVNGSLNETLARTVITSLTTITALFAIVVFGGPVLQGFAFTMIIGFIVGTYSSIFVASSFVIWYLERNKKVKTA